MEKLKKIIVVFLLITFCITPLSAIAEVDTDSIELADPFENNYQSIKDTSVVQANLSPVEEMFNNKENAVSGNILRQAGYDQFKSSSGTNGAKGKYDSSYRLSIGEEVNVYLYGDSVDVMAMSGTSLLPPSSKAEVGSNGAMFVSGIGLVKAEGRTIREVENDIKSIANKKYRNVQVKLSMSSGSEFSVFVYGEVARPGKVYISNNSSILDTLGAAGGVKKTGTLRNIKYNNKSIDLYKTLFFGDDAGIIVKPNDKIFVGRIGNVAALKNGVTHPGIYEYKDNETLKDIVKYAGGVLLTTQQSEVTLTSFNPEMKQKIATNVSWDKVQNMVLKSGDELEFKELYNNVENTISIQGNIKHPGTYVYKDGMRLSDILKGENELLEETFIHQAVIRRVSGDGNSVEIIPVFLREFFAGMNDPLLKGRDVITIYKSTNSTFVDVYGCINTPKHVPYKKGMTLSDVMSEIKFLESDIKSDDEDGFKTTRDEGNVRLKVGTENANKLIPAENIAVEITPPGGKTSIYYMYDVMITSDKLKSIAIAPESKVFFRTLRENEVLKTVKISGFVKEPGVYKFVKGQKLSDVIEIAGGLTDDANLRGIIYKRAILKSIQTNLAIKNNERDINMLRGNIANSHAKTDSDKQLKLDTIEQLKAEEGSFANKYNGRIALNIKTDDYRKINKLNNIEIQDGDDIYIPRIANYVNIIGEVYNEQSFIHKNGTTARYYIREVGGYTPNANRFRLYKVGVNGRSERVRICTKIEPGDTIVVPRKIAGLDWITPITAALQSFSSIFMMAFAIHKW